MKTSCCIDMMFSELPFGERIAAVKNSGLDAIEFWKWTNKDVDGIAKLVSEKELAVSIFLIDSADEKLSHDLTRGIMNAGRADEFVSALKESIPAYKKLGARAMIALIGEHSPYNKENVKKCLMAAIPVLEENDVNLIVEPLNSIDRVGYSMPYVTPVFELLREINNPHIKMLYDIYHQNMMGDFDIEEVEANIDLIGHFHVADAPGRHEPYTGNIDYVSIINRINKTSYDGYIGLEYRATRPDGETFGFLREINN